MKEIYDLKMNKKENEERVVFIKKDDNYITCNYLAFIASDITTIPVNKKDYTVVIPAKDVEKYIECFKRNYISVVFYKDGKPEYEYNTPYNRYDEFGDIYEMAFRALIEIDHTFKENDIDKINNFFERRIHENIL